MRDRRRWVIVFGVGICAIASGWHSSAAHGQKSAAATSTAAARLPYLYLEEAPGTRPHDDLSRRFPAPAGSARVPLPSRSFGEFLRYLPLLPPQTPVLLYDGRPKGRQDVHAAVAALDVGKRDLQQCADAVMRLRAEYLLSYGHPELISFHPDAGKPRALSYSGHTRAEFSRYMTRVFVEAGSASLQAEMQRVGSGAVAPGDVLIQGGHPGHVVMVLDAAQSPDGRRWLLLGQSFMPAQQFHVLRNPSDPTGSPWYDAAALDSLGGLQTPEWLPFHRSDARRFPTLSELP